LRLENLRRTGSSRYETAEEIASSGAAPRPTCGGREGHRELQAMTIAQISPRIITSLG